MPNNTSSLTMSERELLIIKTLAFGPVQQADLYKLCFKNDKGSHTTIQFARRMLKNMVANGYLIKDIFKRRTDRRGLTVYYLDELGARDATVHLGIDRDSIRNTKLTASSLMHELHLAQIFRKIGTEVAEGLYTTLFVWDERLMKKSHDYRKKAEIREARRRGMGFYYPDLSIGIVPRTSKESRIFYLELDMASKERAYWTKKIAKWDHDILVLTPDPDRLNLLKQYIRISPCKSAVKIALTTDFQRGGMKHTQWLDVKANAKGRLDI